MFRKIVSNLSFSPALVGQLGFYAKRLRKEQATRRIGLIFVALALVVQCLAVFQPPEAANAAGPNDFVNGGLGLGANRSINKFLAPYDANTNNLHDIMNYMGISRDEIASATYSSWIVGNKYSWGFNPTFSYAQGERAVNITDANGNVVRTVYAKPNKLLNGANTRIYGWIGHSSRVGWFAVMQACGNLVTDIIPPPPPLPPPPPVIPPKCIYNGAILASSSACKSCPGNANIWVNDSSCTPNITKSKSAVNTTQGGVDATTVVANAGDNITYTISVENKGLLGILVSLDEPLKDVSEYATVTDAGGGTFDNATKTLSWPSVELGPGEKQARTFTVSVLNPIPATPQGVSDPSSYDCVMINVFGNAVSIKVNCPTPKVVVEQVVAQLPHTGPTENMIFAGVVLSIVTYFYARTRQVGKEVRLIRRDLNSGTI